MDSTFSANFQSSVDIKSVTVDPCSFLLVIKYKSSDFLTFNVDITSWWKLLIRVPHRYCLIMVVEKFWSWLADSIISKKLWRFLWTAENSLTEHSVSSLKLALLEMISQHLLLHIFEPVYLWRSLQLCHRCACHTFQLQYPMPLWHFWQKHPVLHILRCALSQNLSYPWPIIFRDCSLYQ